MRQHFKEIISILTEFINDESQMDKVQDASALMGRCIQNGFKIVSCGNGGSMTDAMHFAEELCGRFREDRRPFPSIAISDPSYLSCVANDYGYDRVFSRFVQGMCKEGDVLLAISTSGDSPNVVNAAKVARTLGIKVVALTGKDGGALGKLADIEIRAPYSTYADRAQEIHAVVIHALIDGIEKICV